MDYPDKDMPLIIRKETNKRVNPLCIPVEEIIVSDNTVAIWVYNNVLKGIVFTLSRSRPRPKSYQWCLWQQKKLRQMQKYTKPLE